MRQLLLLIAIAASQAFSQDDLEALRRTRLEKTEVILRIQDRRTLHDGKLISLLADPDALVRRRAYMAYGSIQDSTAIGLLTHGLADPDVTVQEAAAFALGQTGAILSTDTRAQLGHDLIWNRLNATQVPEVLIEEIGKFGTAEALQDLVIRVGDVYPRRFENGMTMAIARFALRGITDPGAVRYLLAGLRLSAQPAWQSVYALQRIGDHPTIRSDIEHLMLLRQDNDPLVRMNLAALLAKMRDVRAAREPLLRLASADPDWRVRVNALRALAVQPVASDVAVLDVFRRAFYDANMHVALAALAALRSSDITAADTSGQAREILQHMSAMVTNTGNEFPWQYQAEAAATLATLLRSAALPSFPAKAWPNPRLRSDLLRAMGTTGDSSAGPPLLAALNDDREDIRCAALEGLASLATLRPSDAGLHRSIRSALPELCKSEDVALVATAAGILADSLFADNTSAPTLLALIPDLQGADDGEALVEVIRALGKLGDTRAVPHLLEILSRSERTVATEAAAALQRITGRDYAGRITAREPFFTDFDFTYLRGLPDTIHIEISTSRGDITAEFYKELAPFAVMSILKLSSQRGFYRGLSFHRVVPNFVIQGGCPRGDGWGGPGFTLRSEFSPVRFQAGTIGIASAGKDTEGSQFFITHSPQPHLDGRYTIIGRVVKGQEIVNAIQRDDRLFE